MYGYYMDGIREKLRISFNQNHGKNPMSSDKEYGYEIFFIKPG